MKQPKLWDRWPKESPPAFAAFGIYRDMGRDRSCAKVGQELGKSKTLMDRWSRVNMWVARAQAFDDNLDKGRQLTLERLAVRDAKRSWAVENALYKRSLGYSYNEITRERIPDSGQKKRHGVEGVALSATEWKKALIYFNHQCAYCGKSDKLTKDHVVPLNRAGALTVQNTVPACGACNSSKIDRGMAKWYKSQKFYLGTRHDKIKTYLDFVKEDAIIKHDLVVTKIVKKFEPPSVMGCKVWLNGRRPDRWIDRTDVDISVTGEISVEHKLTINEIITVLNFNEMPLDKLRLLAGFQR